MKFLVYAAIAALSTFAWAKEITFQAVFTYGPEKTASLEGAAPESALQTFQAASDKGEAYLTRFCGKANVKSITADEQPYLNGGPGAKIVTVTAVCESNLNLENFIVRSVGN